MKQSPTAEFARERFVARWISTGPERTRAVEDFQLRIGKATDLASWPIDLDLQVGRRAVWFAHSRISLRPPPSACRRIA